MLFEHIVQIARNTNSKEKWEFSIFLSIIPSFLIPKENSSNLLEFEFSSNGKSCNLISCYVTRHDRFAKRVQLLRLFFPSLFGIRFELARKFFILPLEEEFFTLLLENYGPHEILSRHPILYGIGTFYSHLPTLVRIEWIGTLQLAAEIFLMGRDFCQRNYSTVARIHVRWNASEIHHLQRHVIST